MSLRTKSRMPASTSVTAARLVSMVSVSVPSVFSGRMAFIVIPLFALSAARVSPARRRQSGTRASDFGRNLAEVRQGRSIRGLCRGVWLRKSERGRRAELCRPHGEEREARGGRCCAPPREPCRPNCSTGGIILRDARKSALLRMRGEMDLPALLETRRQALADRPLRGFADRTGDGDVVEQLLLGASLAQPFVVGGRQRLARCDAGAGIGE